MERSRPAVHRTIVVVDVEGFGDRRRTNAHQVAIRAGLYQALQQAFDGATVSWTDCEHEDRGDGVFILVPAEVAKAFVVDAMPQLLVAALRAHNYAHPVESRIRLRMALHAGEVEIDEYGVTAASVNMAFRLLDAAPLKAALAGSPGLLAIIVSGWFFDEVVRHSRRTDPTTFRPVQVTVKETTTTAWISLPDHAYSPNPAHVAVSAGEHLSCLVAGQSVGELPVPRQLPLAIRDFIGRGNQIAALDEVLPIAAKTPDGDTGADTVTVTIVDGAAGIGKTTLVVRWAHRVQHLFTGGTLFASLRGYGPGTPADPAMVLASFLRALGLAETSIPTGLDALVGLYRSILARRQVLIVLDNAASAEQVRPLLPGAPGCVAVVTSRACLTELMVLEAAHRVSLDPFTAMEASGLLRAIVGTARVDAEPKVAAELMRVCGGLPLAVRIAATRVAIRPQLGIMDVVADIVETRGRGCDNLLGGSMGHSVRSVFDWSYERLSIDNARVFRRLGLHPGPELGIHAAAALTGLAVAVVYGCLEVLVDFHLVEPAGNRRYRMHDLLHAYAAHRAELDDDPEDCRAAESRMLAWYARAAQQADRAAFPVLAGMPGALAPVAEEISFVDRAQALAWLRAECSNLVAAARCALTYGLHELVMALATSGRFMTFRERALSVLHREVVAAGVVAARFNGNQAVEALLLGMRADTLWYLGDLSGAETDYTRALALADRIDDRARRVDGLSGLGLVRLRQDRLREAQECYERALPLSCGVGEGRAEAVVRCNLSQISTRLGEFHQALDHAHQEMVLRRHAGDQTGMAFALCNAALAWQGLGEHDTAIDLCRQALDSYRRLGDIGDDLVRAILTLAISLDHVGDRPAAARCLHEAVLIRAQLGDPRVEETRQQLAALEIQIANDTGAELGREVTDRAVFVARRSGNLPSAR